MQGPQTSTPPNWQIVAKCRLCTNDLEYTLSQRIINQFEIKYFRCNRCELLQTEPPYWLDQAYSSAISQLDTGAIHRNIFSTRLTLLIAHQLGLDPRAKCLDYGGGHGVFTRMMRDAGRPFKWCDKYAENIFARGFEGDPTQTYELVTAFEVFEHLIDVREELSRIFSPKHKYILASTLLHTTIPPKGWWYFAVDTGQHVAFYTRKTLSHVATEFDYHVIPGDAYSLFIRKDISIPTWKRLVLSRILSSAWLAYGLGSIVFELQRPRSLTQSDAVELKARAWSLSR